MSDHIDKVHGFADGQLGAEESAEVSRQLTDDPAMAREYQWAVYLKGLVRAKCTPIECEAEWKKARARLDAIDAVNGCGLVERFVGRWSWGLAACLFAVILFGGLLSRGTADEVSGQQLAGLLGSVGEDQAVTDQDEAVRSLSLQMGGGNTNLLSVVRITNVAQGEVDGHKFAKFTLADSSGRMVLAIIDQAKGFDGLSPIEGRKDYVGTVVNGTNCVGWSSDGRAFLLSGERTTEELLSVCDQIRFSETD